MPLESKDALVWALHSKPHDVFRVDDHGRIVFKDDEARARWAEAAQESARLRRSEQLLVDTQGVAHLGTWEWDVSQTSAVWSDELYRIYGLTRQQYTP